MPSSSSVADDATQTAAKPPTQLLRYEEPFLLHRFLLNDGRVIDVEATRDGSTLRGWLLEQLGATKANGLMIVGATTLEAAE